MELRQLRAFCEVARLRHFTQAAERLGYTQPTVTGQIQLLEDELGVKLFERLGRQVILTAAGEQLRPYAEQILQLSATATALFQQDVEPHGPLRLGIGESLASLLLAPLLQTYRNRYPAVELVMRSGSSRDFKQGLRANHLDVALLLGPALNDDDLIAEPLCAIETAAIVGGQHPYRLRATLSPADLVGQTLLLPEPGCNYRRLLEELLAQQSIEPSSIIESDSHAVTKQFAAAGLGLAFLPRFAVAAEVASGSLQELAWNGPPFSMLLQLCHHREKWQSPTLQTFRQLLTDHFSTDKKEALRR